MMIDQKYKMSQDKIRYFFITALDTLAFRGNRLFGDEGSAGEVSLLPYPSVFAGAFRSLLYDKLSNEEKKAFKDKKPQGPIGEQLGSYCEPGNFKLVWLSLAKYIPDEDKYFVVTALPADVSVYEDGNKQTHYKYLKLVDIKPNLIQLDTSFNKVPILQLVERPKVRSGFMQGLEQYLNCDEKLTLVNQTDICTRENRVGIAMNSDLRRVEKGKLYMSEYLRYKENFGYLVGILGACSPEYSIPKDSIPESGFLRLGGDGKATYYKEINDFEVPTAKYEDIITQKSFKVVLSSEGTFENGWIPDVMKYKDDEKSYYIEHEGLTAKLVSVVLKKFDHISGWDMLKQRPKDLIRVVPRGSVYFFQLEKGTLEDLKDLDTHLRQKGMIDCEKFYNRSIEGFGYGYIALDSINSKKED
jgi:CRISPR-associated protein Cmr3